MSSVLFTQLSSGLAELGWTVNAFPSNRDSSDPSLSYPSEERFFGVRFRRIWRPPWRQASSAGRVLNALWIVARWSLLALRTKNPPDAILLGTDPIFSILIVPVWRFLHPQVKIVQWCFDLYPDAAIADGLLPRGGLAVKVLRLATSYSYRRCDHVADIGACMKHLLLQYEPCLRTTTLVPWALSEPLEPLPTSNPDRATLFGQAQLGLMYSGSFGRAHAFEDMLELMRHLRSSSVHLVLSAQGNREASLRSAVHDEDCNITFVPPASHQDLEQRLAAADIHLVTLRKEWTGTVVPSKFFGALAVGRPILFCGSRHSSLAHWIEHHEIGWVLESGDAAKVAVRIEALLAKPQTLLQMKQRCHRIYQEHFSRDKGIRSWNHLLLNELAR